MFSSITSLLLFITVTLKVSNEANAARNYIDRIVKYCETKEDRFAGTEDKYAEKGPQKSDEPQLDSTPTVFLFREQTILYRSEVMQRKFECMANRTKKSDEKLRSSLRYLSLVEKCKASQSTKVINNQRTECSIKGIDAYRGVSGECNNIINRHWGATLSSFRRRWPANYEGVSGFRKSVNGKKPLPNARYISRKLIKPSNSTTRKYNALFAFFGQVLAYDMAGFPVSLEHGTQSLDCCKNATNGGVQHPQCAPILIDPTDEFYSKNNINCFHFVRAVPYDTCSVGKRIPINYVTAWIDLSQMYGSTFERAMKLSTLDSGKLKSVDVEGGELLPPDEESGSSCGDEEKGEYCFKSGDDRVNTVTPVMILHILLMREHNRIADTLKALNPFWDDLKLYHESRKILIAEFEMIIYNEYLPVLLGQKLMSKYRLNIGSGGAYDPEIDPSISVIFYAAAYPIPSITPGKVVYGEQADQLRDLYSNAVPIYKQRIPAFLYKMTNTEAEKYDRYMPEDFTLFFLKPFNGTWGFDINALLIQRGRDVGLPTYTQVIEYKEKRNGTIKTFDDLKSYIEPDCLDIFKNLYADVRDIDFYVGIICEKYPDDMIISETAAEIIAEQFQRLKYGDRFYFENDLSLTFEQKQTLLNASLAKLICDNTEVHRFQKLVFMLPSNKNKRKNCSAIPGVDLTKWKENIV